MLAVFSARIREGFDRAMWDELGAGGLRDRVPLGELGERTLRKVRRRVMPLIVLLYFVACGISRLARYNVTAEALSQEGGKDMLTFVTTDGRSSAKLQRVK